MKKKSKILIFPQDDMTEEMFDQISPILRREIEALIPYEDEILKKLQDEQLAELFATNPAQALHEMKIPISAHLRKRLNQQRPLTLWQTPPSFKLPNGQTITPKIKIRFTKREEE